MLEHFFLCPYCNAQISMLLDSSLQHATYIEDCEVCCRPIEIELGFDQKAMLTTFNAIDIEQ